MYRQRCQQLYAHDETSLLAVSEFESSLIELMMSYASRFAPCSFRYIHSISTVLFCFFPYYFPTWYLFIFFYFILDAWEVQCFAASELQVDDDDDDDDDMIQY